MSHFIVHGGKPLSGEISVGGAKNHAIKMLPAALLCKESVLLTHMPVIEDVARLRDLLSSVGYETIDTKPGSVRVIPSVRSLGTDLPRSIAERIRTSILFVGPLLAREGRVCFPHPGGCVIGRRPIDVFLDGWRTMGAVIRENTAGFDIRARELRGIDYTFRLVSHTGTEGLMMTAVLAKGRTILRNAALEPEVVALANFLNARGARIQGAGTPLISIEGTGGTLLKGGTCQIMPDRLEAGSFAILAALLGKDVKITHCDPSHMEVLLAHLRSAGADITQGKDWLSVTRAAKIQPVNVRTHEYPGFATDYQAPFTVLLTQAHGQSMVFETIFEGRLSYMEDLNRMGAHITQCDLHRAIVHGPAKLRSRDFESPDLRAGMAFVIAALVARGVSRIGNIYQIDRGYEKLDERLRVLGADIKRE
ncbi:MAG: UDP-N-acetylglucosamine 1-carboxyvinyltransferase [Candidatus Ryanbacteria bacterium RIFCSPHIGHO2_02_FULL_45_13b]|uniref:UDP-N-acetylglucosamine 1-carboxyvinyltransferase n=1 Tax=Candidatus Ryanbacteria bacterium RIFCSPHIGHO2_02_FULL_45_13b TaxID=1802117 RepID=A0A1G2G478_9BACT|nr:MAG: UDP-N-acetylglucosamine 1-carboxyvinyltransferase [Candidatus Ryanbacteria bacterium RIFCSPHIGHO2_02_FULL_45_13b]